MRGWHGGGKSPFRHVYSMGLYAITAGEGSQYQP